MGKLLKLIGNPHTNKKFIKMNGKTYILQKTKTKGKIEELTFKEMDIKEYEKILDDVAEKVSKKTNVKDLIKQALYDMPIESVKLIEKEMKKEKPVVRHNQGCFFLSVGGEQIRLRD